MGSFRWFELVCGWFKGYLSGSLGGFRYFRSDFRSFEVFLEILVNICSMISSNLSPTLRLLVFMEINFREIKFQMDKFSRISRFLRKSSKIYLSEICIILVSKKINPHWIFVEVVIQYGFHFKIYNYSFLTIFDFFPLVRISKLLNSHWQK